MAINLHIINLREKIQTVGCVSKLFNSNFLAFNIFTASKRRQTVRGNYSIILLCNSNKMSVVKVSWGQCLPDSIMLLLLFFLFFFEFIPEIVSAIFDIALY